MRNACIAVHEILCVHWRTTCPLPPPISLFPHGLQQWQLLVCHCRRMSAFSCNSLTFRLLYDGVCGYLSSPLTGYDICGIFLRSTWNCKSLSSHLYACHSWHFLVIAHYPGTHDYCWAEFIQVTPKGVVKSHANCYTPVLQYIQLLMCAEQFCVGVKSVPNCVVFIEYVKYITLNRV